MKTETAIARPDVVFDANHDPLRFAVAFGFIDRCEQDNARDGAIGECSRYALKRFLAGCPFAYMGHAARCRVQLDCEIDKWRQAGAPLVVLVRVPRDWHG